MKQLQLIDRVVVEIMSQDGTELTASNIANQLRMVADEIEDGIKGNNYTDEDWTGDTTESKVGFEVLWEHECTDYGGFRMGDDSLIRDAYYGSEKKEEFPVLTLMREDLEQKGFDTSNLGDEWMEKIASKVGDILLDSDYLDHLVWAADYYEVPRKEEL